MANKKAKPVKVEITNVRQVSKKGNRCYEITVKEKKGDKEHVRFIDPKPLLAMRDQMGLNETSEFIGKEIEMTV